MTNARPTEKGPPRLFLRRAAAFILDSLVYSILFAFLVGAAGLAFPSLQPALGTSFLNSRSCTQDGVPAVAGDIEALWPEKDADLTAEACTVDSVFQASKYTVVVSQKRLGEDGTDETRSVSVQTDREGRPIFPSSAVGRITSLLDLFALPLFFGLMTGLFGRSAGKRLLGLHITPEPYAKSPPAIGLPRALAREYLKFWPLCAFAVAEFILSSGVPPVTDISAAVALLAAADAPSRAFGLTVLAGSSTMLVLFVWWVWPMTIWRGRMFYDAITGNWVVLRN